MPHVRSGTVCDGGLEPPPYGAATCGDTCALTPNRSHGSGRRRDLGR